VAPIVPGSAIDKPWIVCDNSRESPFFGHCYIEWGDVADGFRIRTSVSIDGGRTWGPALETDGGGSGSNGQPVVQPNGTVVIPTLGPAFFTSAINVLEAFRSTDGGATWSAPMTFNSVSFHNPPGLRAGPLPSAEVDRTGRVYVVWPDCRFRANCSANDLLLSRSDGISWSPPVRIPIDSVTSGADHFIPGLAVDPTSAGDYARLSLTYYSYPDAACAPASCRLTVGFISSRDGGDSWSASRQLVGPMPLDWFPNTSSGRMVGDYISTSFMHKHAFPFFAVANPPKSDGSFDEAIATVPGGLRVRGRVP
jgi:hypothetical protein